MTVEYSPQFNNGANAQATRAALERIAAILRWEVEDAAVILDADQRHVLPLAISLFQLAQDRVEDEEDEAAEAAYWAEEAGEDDAS